MGFIGLFAPTTYTNIVSLGPTVQSDIAWNFVDANANDLFSPNQSIVMNTANTKNYTSWWLAIFENGGQNRYWTKGWATGPIPNALDLGSITDGAFNTGGAPFAQIPVSYTVQFAITKSCNTQWIQLDKNFSVCPAGLGCRAGEEEELTLYPNPAKNSFQISNFVFNSMEQQRFVVSDMSGRILKSYEQIPQSEFDISDLSSGLYLVNIFQGGRRIHTAKLSVVK